MSTPELLSLAIGWEMALCFIKGTVFLKREQVREITVSGGQAEGKSIFGGSFRRRKSTEDPQLGSASDATVSQRNTHRYPFYWRNNYLVPHGL